jgi:hypothetical protein
MQDFHETVPGRMEEIGSVDAFGIEAVSLAGSMGEFVHAA